ncbi:MAG TPA: PilN domain-containing protein [Candidatus Eisenbacteria bacterium]
MIRINLLPGEERKHRRAPVTFKTGDLVLPVMIGVLALMFMGGTYLSQVTRAAQLRRNIAEVDAQARALAPQIERVNRLAQERAELDLRLGIINKLEKGRTQTVRLMDDLARALPDHVWLTSATQDAGGTLSLEGVALSNLVVSDLMTHLDRSPMFADVELDVAERTTIGDKDAVKFRLRCRVTPDEPAQ